MAVSRKAMTEGIRTPIILRTLIDAALQSLSQKSEILASTLYTREPLGCSSTRAFFGRFLKISGIATPVCATLRYDCHRQSLLFQIRCAEHHRFAMTCRVRGCPKI